MQEYVSDSVIPTESPLSASNALARRSAALAWDEDALKSWRRLMHAGAAKPNWLCAALAEIVKAVSNGLQEDPESAQRCMQRVIDILRVDPWFTKVIGEFEIASGQHSKPILGGLALWQIRRLTAHIEADLAAKVRIKDLAGLIKLSSSHFSRAFKQSFADTPHRYVMRRRVERAKALMLATNGSLGRIAADCGFADQPHFNRQFRRLVGEKPNAWRRARACAPTLNDRLTFNASTARVVHWHGKLVYSANWDLQHVHRHRVGGGNW
jgi:AraC family transcriptional regulator